MEVTLTEHDFAQGMAIRAFNSLAKALKCPGIVLLTFSTTVEIHTEVYETYLGTNIALRSTLGVPLKGRLVVPCNSMPKVVMTTEPALPT